MQCRLNVIEHLYSALKGIYSVAVSVLAYICCQVSSYYRREGTMKRIPLTYDVDV